MIVNIGRLKYIGIYVYKDVYILYFKLIIFKIILFIEGSDENFSLF